ncbi:hypothetical protein [Nocardia sp. NPDC051570]|uniref:hypothetical protein n=1 Tax=Nocardia sp. NPDC051570 TaxID=3364324 RepID=UPI0037933E92
MTGDHSGEWTEDEWNEAIRQYNIKRSGEIRELEDRWIFNPLRNRAVVQVNWLDDRIELICDSADAIVVAYDSELNPAPVEGSPIDRRAIDSWDRIEFERTISNEILSAVAFKTGSLRVVLRNRWHLHAAAPNSASPVAIRSGGHIIWDGAGLRDDIAYTVRRAT